MAERSTIVADASIVGRWYINSPPFVQEARRVRDDFDDGKITLAAPENLLHEVTGAIHHAVFAGRLSARRATEQLEHFLTRDITFVETNDLVRPAWELSLRYGCSYYDAIYWRSPAVKTAHSFTPMEVFAALWPGAFPWRCGSRSTAHHSLSFGQTVKLLRALH